MEVEVGTLQVVMKNLKAGMDLIWRWVGPAEGVAIKVGIPVEGDDGRGSGTARPRISASLAGVR